MLPADILRRLSYSKYFLLRSRSLQRQNTELSSAESVLLAHDATEMLLRTVADHVGAKPVIGFMKLWSAIKDATGVEPPHKGQMERFNKIRVSLKHQGIMPNAQAVSDVLPIVDSFCLDVSTLFLKLDFETISLADLISNEEARGLVKKAETAKSEGDLPEALVALGLAFDSLHGDSATLYRPSLLDRNQRAPFIRDRTTAELFRALRLEELSKHVGEITKTLNMLILGIDPKRFREFQRLTPMRLHMASGKYQIALQPGAPAATVESYEYCYQFVIDFASKFSG